MTDKTLTGSRYFEIGRYYKMDNVNYLWMRKLLFRCTGFTDAGSALLTALHVNSENRADESAIITVVIQTEQQMKRFMRVTLKENECQTPYDLQFETMHSNLRNVLGYPITEVHKVMPEVGPMANLKTGSVLSAQYRKRAVNITFDVSKNGHITPYYKFKNSLFRRKIFGRIAPYPKVHPSTMTEVMYYINNTFSKVVLA